MEAIFPNPERAWQADREHGPIPFEDVARRIGPFAGQVVRLSGGLANDSFLIGDDRVLRIYRRDATAVSKERSLLTSRWKGFQVPRILGSGSDYLILEYVEHGPLMNTVEHGSAVGKCLAEIHQRRFSSHGVVDSELEISEHWGDFQDVMEKYWLSISGRNRNESRLFDRVRQRLAERRNELEAVCEYPVLLHGDFKASNLKWSHEERLLVLDWEFAYAGPALMDVGQLIRWGISSEFREGFEEAYTDNGGELPEEWIQMARELDVGNLADLLLKADPNSKRAQECRIRIEEILAK